MKRRSFLRHVSHGLALPALIQPFQSKGNSNLFQEFYRLATTSDRVLVIIYLEGGNDGLNTVIPLDALSALHNVRPHVMLPESSLLPLPLSEVALHPALKDLKELYLEGKMQIIQNVGYENQNFSHFRSTDIWLSGSDANQLVTSGWAGRLLYQDFPEYPINFPNEATPHPLAVEIGWGSSLLFQGPAANMGMVLSDASAFYDLLDIEGITYPDTPSGNKLEYVSIITQQSQAYGKVVKEAAEKVSQQQTYPDTYLAQQLKIVARLVAGGLQSPIYLLRLNGFDTHDGQVEESDHTLGEHAVLLQTLNDAIVAFMKDLKFLNIEDKVLTGTISEFGRRIVSNASLGTDHGSSAPIFVFGNQIVGGVTGSNPNISYYATYEDNLQTDIDFRSVYAAWMGQWLTHDEAKINEVLFKNFTPVTLLGQNTISHTQRMAHEISVYPNPVQEQLNVTFYSTGGNTTIQIRDVNGSHYVNLFDGNLDMGKKQIGFSIDISTGFYMLVILQKNSKKTIPFLKK